MEWRKYGKEGAIPPGNWVKATLAEEVWGVAHRKSNARAFAKAVIAAERKGLQYGVALAPQPHNPADRYAIAILGQCEVKRWFRSPALKEWHIGYVRRDLARELHDDFLEKGVEVASQLRHIFERNDYLEFQYFVLAPPGHSHSKRQRARLKNQNEATLGSNRNIQPD